MSNAEILYEVSVSVAPEIRSDYLAWLDRHMSEMLQHEGFLSGARYVNTENENEITSHYRLRDMAAMEAYLAGPAKQMRADGAARFGDKMQARRRILQTIG